MQRVKGVRTGGASDEERKEDKANGHGTVYARSLLMGREKAHTIRNANR